MCNGDFYLTVSLLYLYVLNWPIWDSLLCWRMSEECMKTAACRACIAIGSFWRKFLPWLKLWWLMDSVWLWLEDNFTSTYEPNLLLWRDSFGHKYHSWNCWSVWRICFIYRGEGIFKIHFCFCISVMQYMFSFLMMYKIFFPKKGQNADYDQ